MSRPCDCVCARAGARGGAGRGRNRVPGRPDSGRDWAFGQLRGPVCECVRGLVRTPSGASRLVGVGGYAGHSCCRPRPSREAAGRRDFACPVGARFLFLFLFLSHKDSVLQLRASARFNTQRAKLSSWFRDVLWSSESTLLVMHAAADSDLRCRRISFKICAA